MRSLSLFTVLLSMFLLGCSHTHIIDVASAPSELDEINHAMNNSKVKITLTDERVFTGMNPRIGEDSTSWFDSALGEKRAFPHSAIEKIVIKKRFRGAWEGIKYGALFGGATGLIIGFAIDADEDAGGYGPDLSVAGVTFFGALGSALVGLPVGTIIGSKDEYIIVAPPNSSFESTREHKENN